MLDENITLTSIDVHDNINEKFIMDSFGLLFTEFITYPLFNKRGWTLTKNIQTDNGVKITLSLEGDNSTHINLIGDYTTGRFSIKKENRLHKYNNELRVRPMDIVEPTLFYHPTDEHAAYELPHFNRVALLDLCLDIMDFLKISYPTSPESQHRRASNEVLFFFTIKGGSGGMLLDQFEDVYLTNLAVCQALIGNDPNKYKIESDVTKHFPDCQLLLDRTDSVPRVNSILRLPFHRRLTTQYALINHGYHLNVVSYNSQNDAFNFAYNSAWNSLVNITYSRYREGNVKEIKQKVIAFFDTVFKEE